MLLPRAVGIRTEVKFKTAILYISLFFFALCAGANTIGDIPLDFNVQLGGFV